jgi:hypothetical protein
MRQPIRIQYIYRDVAPSRHVGLDATIISRDLAIRFTVALASSQPSPARTNPNRKGTSAAEQKVPCSYIQQLQTARESEQYGNLILPSIHIKSSNIPKTPSISSINIHITTP